jgi:uncharacterized protein YbjT (DUF2867 family)
MPKPITVLVTGATGQQGGAVARLLLDKGHEVRALTRRPGSQRAMALRAAGAEIREGDLDDAPSVRDAAEGADAVFLMATPFEEGVEAEARQGRRAAEACRQAGVKHLVYSSVAGADRDTGIPHFDSKREVELFLQDLGVPYTILAPVFFMENLLGATSLQALATGTLSLPLPRRKALEVVAVADIAGMARLALERPGVFQGKRIELASDSLTGPEMATVLGQVTRSSIGYAEAPIAAVRERSEDLARMFQWLAEVGYDTDVLRLRSSYPEVGWRDFRAWARQQDWSALDVASAEQPTI